MSQTISDGPAERSYEDDILSWARAQAALLEDGRFDELDLANLVEEISSVGGSDKREIDNRLAVLIQHLLKWRYQPGRRTASWEATIRHQRSLIARVVGFRPSLKHRAAETFSRPPARYSEAALVKKLEELGIGRPSTYAPTISTIQHN